MRGKLRGWRRSALLGGVTVVLAGVAYAMGVTGIWMKAGPAIAADKLSFWVEGGDAGVISRLQTALTEAGFVATKGDEETADLTLRLDESPGSVPVLESTVGAPAKLESAKVVTASPKAKYYLSTRPRQGLSGSRRQNLTAMLTAALKSAPANSWSLTALGDIIIGRTVYLQMRRYGDPHKPFAHFADTIRKSDLALADLECSISDARAVITQGGMTFVSPFSAAAGLKSSGIDAVSVSNNHAFNGGESGYIDTLDEMQRLGIGTFGGGRNDAQAHSPLIHTVKGVKVALLGYSSITGTKPAGATTPGMAYLSMAPWGPFGEAEAARMEADIRAAKAQADVVFVYYHWGTEYTHTANDHQRAIAHRAIDAGADLILGTHPHWVQGIEWYKDRHITYSLGNFIFDQEWSLKTKQGTFLQATFDGSRLTSAELVPYQIEDYLQPRPVSDTVGRGILNDIFTHSWWPN